MVTIDSNPFSAHFLGGRTLWHSVSTGEHRLHTNSRRRNVPNLARPKTKYHHTRETRFPPQRDGHKSIDSDVAQLVSGSALTAWLDKYLGSQTVEENHAQRDYDESTQHKWGATNRSQIVSATFKNTVVQPPKNTDGNKHHEEPTKQEQLSDREQLSIRTCRNVRHDHQHPSPVEARRALLHVSTTERCHRRAPRSRRKSKRFPDDKSTSTDRRPTRIKYHASKKVIYGEQQRAAGGLTSEFSDSIFMSISVRVCSFVTFNIVDGGEPRGCSYRKCPFLSDIRAEAFGFHYFIRYLGTGDSPEKPKILRVLFFFSSKQIITSPVVFKL